MPLLLATSCFQALPIQAAIDELRLLQPDGIQLCPNHPLPLIDAESLAIGGYKTHQGFSAAAAKHDVWLGGRLAWSGDSAHPPLAKHVPDDWDWLAALYDATRPTNQGIRLGCVETMYPEFAALGNGFEIDLAMEHKIPLAVDIAHLSIQRSKNLLTLACWKRIQDYDNIVEIHCSHSSGGVDDHKPLVPPGSGHVTSVKDSYNYDIDGSTWGLSWARERLKGEATVVLESFLHNLTNDERRHQIEILRR